MAIAYWCILIAALLPYVWVFIAKRGPRYDNRDPRGWLAKQDNPRAHRANSAQFNAFEAFAPFAAGVLMAQFAGVDPAPSRCSRWCSSPAGCCTACSTSPTCTCCAACAGSADSPACCG